jgi:hypothetical protein
MKSSYNMRITIIIGIALILVITACIDAPHDNVYDPKNPDRAYLSVLLYEIGSYPLNDAAVFLTQNSTTIKSDTTDPEGTAEFDEIIPGIYDVRVEALHYSTVTCTAESLWAGVYIENQRIELNTLDFEDETYGTSSPYMFEPLSGPWTITEDLQLPASHSTPKVYCVSNNSANDIAISLCQPETESFLFQAKIKVDTSSGDSWRAGVTMRYQDAGNYYTVALSPDTVYCDLVTNGQKTNIQTKATESDPGVWHTMTIEKPNDWFFIRLTLDNTLLFTVYDNVFPGGQVGLIAYNAAGSSTTTVYFDDVTLDLTYGSTE